MKKLLIVAILALTSATAYADNQVGVMSNTAGGEIILTQDNCRVDAKFLKVLSTHPNGTVLEGCWNYIKSEKHIRVLWVFENGRVSDTPEMRMYPVQNFQLR